jgi:hypothetical protein
MDTREDLFSPVNLAIVLCYSRPDEPVIVETVKKSMAAMTSRWFRRNDRQRRVGSGCLGHRPIQPETVRSEPSKPISSSP